MSRTGDVHVRRVYDRKESSDGARILIDRVWPRGVRKAELEYDEWLKEVAPSKELRSWYGHAPERFDEFARRYRAELGDEPGRQALERLRALSRQRRVTLLTATRDVEHSHATVLATVLGERS